MTQIPLLSSILILYFHIVVDSQRTTRPEILVDEDSFRENGVLKKRYWNMSITISRLKGEGYILTCEAPYPVKWVLLDISEIPWNQMDMFTRSQRTFTNFWDPSTYQFVLHIFFPTDDFQDDIAIYSCRGSTSPNTFHRNILVQYYKELRQLHISHVDDANFTTTTRLSLMEKSCPIRFYIYQRIDADGNFGLKCEADGKVLNNDLYRSISSAHDSTVELYSMRNLKTHDCVTLLRDEIDCAECPYFRRPRKMGFGGSDIYYCQNLGVELFPNLDDLNQTTYSFQRPEGYLESVISLKYTRHAMYYVGEQLNVSLDWEKARFYFSQGDLFLTLSKDGDMIHSETIKYSSNDDWSATELRIDPQLTTFNETGSMVLTLYVPLWNSSDWIYNTADFKVKEPVELHFDVPFEKIEFEVGSKNRSLVCNSEGDPEHIHVVWKKDNQAYLAFLKQIHSAGISSTEYMHYIIAQQAFQQLQKSNKAQSVLQIPEVTLYHGGHYSCTSINRLGSIASKIFSVSLIASYDRTFLVGNNATLTCDHTLGTNESTHDTFVWIKDNERTNGTLSTYRSISLISLKPSDAGMYKCTAQTVAGYTQTSVYSIIVAGGEPDRAWVYFVPPIAVTVIVLLAVTLRLACRLHLVLNEAEFKEFMNGKASREDGDKFISNLPYNTKYEVDKRQIKIDTNCVLGSGEFGIVYKGGFVSLETLETVEVAVKTVKSNSSPTHIISLLNELKVLAYLENGHSNVLNIVGACTSRVRNGEIYVCVELCKHNLLSLLKKSKESGSFNKRENLSGESDSELNTHKLMRWAYQIADGMDFLNTKNVIHGDLASRNILISMKYMEVKIADFGLGRVLDNYQYFIADKNCPLPWRWMSIEALADKKFSWASDVWAFGIVLWEIFSLGELPYPGLHWNIDFVDQLRNGLRLKCPEYGSDEMYTLMKNCWESEPKCRQDFSHIKINISKMLGTDCSGYSILK